MYLLMLDQIEKLEAAKAFLSLLFLTTPYLSLPFLSFPYLSSPFLTFPYHSLPFLTFSSLCHALQGLTGYYRALLALFCIGLTD